MNEEIKKNDRQSDTIMLHSGEYLTLESASVITKNNLSNIIILAGSPDCGKTTLLSYLNNTFQRGPFAGYHFAGSQTLISFEKCSHLSRIASKGVKPDTERTKLSEKINFLHLNLFNSDNQVKSDILITDISGERFRLLRDFTEECRNFELLHRCNSFSLLIDGEKIKDSDLRHQCKHDNLRLLRNCADAGMLGNNSNIIVLFSKWDLIDNEHDEEPKNFIEEFKSDILSRYNNKFHSLEFYNICSQSINEDKVKTGFNLDQVLKTWIEKSSILHNDEIHKTDLMITNREFSNYYKKV